MSVSLNLSQILKNLIRFFIMSVYRTLCFINNIHSLPNINNKLINKHYY